MTMQQYLVSRIEVILEKKDFTSEPMKKIEQKSGLIQQLPSNILFKKLSKTSVCDHADSILNAENKQQFLDIIIKVFELGDDPNTKRSIEMDFKDVDINDEDIDLVKKLIIFIDTYTYNEKVDDIESFDGMDEFAIKVLGYMDIEKMNRDVALFMKQRFQNFQSTPETKIWIECISDMLESRANQKM